jgi:hypothetical protein
MADTKKHPAGGSARNPWLAHHSWRLHKKPEALHKKQGFVCRQIAETSPLPTIQTQLQSRVYFCYKNNDMSDRDTEKERPMYPSVTAAFSGYEPPSNVVVMAQRIVDSVPEKYLQGLTEVVLTNAGALSRNRRRSVSKSRGRKVRIKEARGLYHPASQQRGAWIEIFVDNDTESLGRRMVAAH